MFSVASRSGCQNSTSFVRLLEVPTASIGAAAVAVSTGRRGDERPMCHVWIYRCGEVAQNNGDISFDHDPRFVDMRRMRGVAMKRCKFRGCPKPIPEGAQRCPRCAIKERKMLQRERGRRTDDAACGQGRLENIGTWCRCGCCDLSDKYRRACRCRCTLGTT